MVADQMISRVENLQNNNFIHRDMKPDNFLMGIKQKAGVLYMIDFGLSKRFKDPKNG